MSTLRPRVDFVIGGAQKAGTSALARYLSLHPSIRLPRDKEAHVFDAPDFDDAAGAHAVDARYAAAFAREEDHAPALHGDATPIYMFHPRIVARIARYNPRMRWIILVRDPVDRAISHWHMEHARGAERWPMWAAVLLEDWRLKGHADDLRSDSPLRKYSYRRRGDYARQLDALHAAFPQEQLLLLQSRDLRQDPGATLRRVHRFLDVEPLVPSEDELAPVFEGRYATPGALAPTRLLLRVLTRGMRRRLRSKYGVSF